MKEMTANAPTIQTEKRRGVRFPVVVPVEAKWQEASGKSVKEAAHAVEVNALGGLLEMKAYPSVGSQLELTNLLSGEAFRARVVGTRRSTEGRMLGVAVELLIPSETFWGVNFRLKRTSAELVKLHHLMQSGSNLDPRILREFRDAVDYVRKTAWAAEEWQERRLQKRRPPNVLPRINAERPRRGPPPHAAISHDLSAPTVSHVTP